MRFYGRFPGTDATYAGEGYGLYPELTAGNGGDRTFCASPRDTPERPGTGDCGGDPVSDFTASAFTAKVAASGNDSAGDDPRGREKGILAGANVVMPNLSPTSVRKQYELYDNKICTGDEAAECRHCLGNRMQSIGYELVVDRGDAPV